MVVTNKEKAKEIGAKHGISTRGFDTDIINAIEEMAEFKDEQFKNQINYWLDYFERGKEQGFVSQNSYNDMRYFASKVLNEPRF